NIAIRERLACQQKEIIAASHDPAALQEVEAKHLVEDLKFELERYKVENQNKVVQDGPYEDMLFLELPDTQKFMKAAEEKMHESYVAWQEMRTGLSATPPTVEQVMKQNEKKAKAVKVENKVEAPKFKEPMALRDSMKQTQTQPEVPKLQKESAISNMMQLRKNFGK
ncbi:MAG TPA: hypothetical protein VM577_01450, partial [Anaerovoracaceae bacterium]|nr:hypothetical protein [Anaerovoracaceae bacterium]